MFQPAVSAQSAGAATSGAAQRHGGQSANSGTKTAPARPDGLGSRRGGCKSVRSSGEMPGMMDKGSDYLGKGRSNGTKSPSNASNGHFSDESGSDDEHGEYSLEQPLCMRRDDADMALKVCSRAAVFQMWGCGSEPTIRPTFPTSSPVSRRRAGGRAGGRPMVASVTVQPSRREHLMARLRRPQTRPRLPHASTACIRCP